MSDSSKIELPEPNRRVRRAESVLRARSDRIALCIECSTDESNESACVRTAEAMGVQTVYLVMMPSGSRQSGADRGISKSISKAASRFLTLHRFNSTPEAIEAMRADGREIWATDLGSGASLLAEPAEARFLLEGALAARSQGEVVSDSYVRALEEGSKGGLELPSKMAIVMGRELDGVGPVMLEACDRRVFLPMFGFCESFNLSVATGLVLQRLFSMCPEARGDLVRNKSLAASVREEWADKLSRTPDVRENFRIWNQAIATGAAPPPLIGDLRREDKFSKGKHDQADIVLGRIRAGTKRPREEQEEKS